MKKLRLTNKEKWSIISLNIVTIIFMIINKNSVFEMLAVYVLEIAFMGIILGILMISQVYVEEKSKNNKVPIISLAIVSPFICALMVLPAIGIYFLIFGLFNGWLASGGSRTTLQILRPILDIIIFPGLFLMISEVIFVMPAIKRGRLQDNLGRLDKEFGKRMFILATFTAVFGVIFLLLPLNSDLVPIVLFGLTKTFFEWLLLREKKLSIPNR